MKQPEINLNPQRIYNRRLKVFGLTIVSIVLATLKWTTVIPTDITLLTRSLMIGLFVLTFGWIALFFWSSVFGFFKLLKRSKVPGVVWSAPERRLSTRTAVLMPVYNESPQSTAANLLAMADELAASGQGKAFDFFILSDTTNPKIWVEEEMNWHEAQKLMPEGMKLYYRRRPRNEARKSGNIEDFCNKWGAGYDFMVVLDADSLIEAKTVVTMAQLMEVNPQTGIIQVPPQCVNKHTLFARMQQFAGKVYGPIVSAGLAYWQVSDSNYWGHNAIIRVKAFIECCGLPVLKGRAPFGGHILSHDFVEAALIRRGGWAAWLLPELKGSYEECPPTMIDYAMRDRRWCQGEMQHIKILVARDFHPVSRLHFTIGVMSYLSSPLWMGLLLTGIMIALGRDIFPPVYFSEARSLFPNWPVFDKIGTIMLFVISMLMLFLPKFLGLIVYLLQGGAELRKGAVKSVFAEIVISTLMAPVMMLFQSKFVLDVFLGRDAGWKTQNRDDTSTSWRYACQRHGWHTFFGVLTLAVVWRYTPELFWWMLPITLGLILSIPVSVLTSRESLGLWFQKHHLFVIPEELREPAIIGKARKYRQKLESLRPSQPGVELVVCDGQANALHLLMLEVNGPAPQSDAVTTAAAQIKLENYINHKMPLDLSRDEEVSLLYDRDALNQAHLALRLEGRL